MDLNIINSDQLRNLYQDISASFFVQSEEAAPGSHLDLGDGSVLTPVSRHRSSKIRTYVHSKDKQEMEICVDLVRSTTQTNILT